MLVGSTLAAISWPLQSIQTPRAFTTRIVVSHPIRRSLRMRTDGVTRSRTYASALTRVMPMDSGTLGHVATNAVWERLLTAAACVALQRYWRPGGQQASRLHSVTTARKPSGGYPLCTTLGWVSAGSLQRERPFVLSPAWAKVWK